MTFWIGPGRPGAGEGDRAAVVARPPSRRPGPTRCRAGQRDLGGDADVGEAVVEERQVVEHVLARLPAEHVHAEAGGARRELLGQLQVGVHRVLSGGSGGGGRRRRVAARRAAPAVGELDAGGRSAKCWRIAALGARASPDRAAASSIGGVERRPMRRAVAAGRPGHADVRARVRLELAPDAPQRAVPGPFDEVAVEGRVRGRLRDAYRRRRPRAASHRGSLPAASRSLGRQPRASPGGRPIASSSARTTYASSSSSRDGRRTRAPRNGGDLHDAQRLEVPQRLAHRRLAGAQLAGDPGLDDPGPGRVACRRGSPRGGGP